jgi:hypothetical protein
MISGVVVTQDEQSYIEGRIHGLIEAEIADYQRERDAALRGETRPARRAPVLKVALHDVPLPPARLARVRAQIGRFAVEQLGDRLPGGATNRLRPIDDDGGYAGPDGDDGSNSGDGDNDTGSVEQGLDGPGVCITVGGVPGRRLDLAGIVALGEPPAWRPWHIGIVDRNANPIWPWRESGDVIEMQIDRGVTQNLGRDDMVIGLANLCTWAKEMVAYSTCGWRTGTVHQPRYNPIPSTIRLKHAHRGANTVILRKPEFAGYWVDKLHLDPNQFWTTLGSRIVTLIWRYD